MNESKRSIESSEDYKADADKAINQYYNKQISHYREICKRMNNRDYSRRMDRMTGKRNVRADDYLHKAGRYVINYCMEHDIHNIVIAKNKEWKQNSGMSKRVNQQFVQILFLIGYGCWKLLAGYIKAVSKTKQHLSL